MSTLNTKLILALLSLAAVPLRADEVIHWNELANRLALLPDFTSLNPLFHTRMLAMSQVAVHDALNSIERRYECYTTCSPVPAAASAEAAVASAAYLVLSDQFGRVTAFGFASRQAELSAAYADSLAAIADGADKMLGIQVGQAAAERILRLRAADRAYLLPVRDLNYPQGTRPGEYRFTPLVPFAFGPQWGTVPPFVLDATDQFRPNAPYVIRSRQYTEDYNEVKALGGDGTGTPSARTADQTQIARFWLESSPIGWNRIARTAASQMSLWENARLLALLNLALADGYIGSFEAKYRHAFWRPVTAIREGNADGNDDTIGDANWNPLATTPAMPDHDSAHAVEGGAASEVLEQFFRGRCVNFQTCSTTLPAGSRCGEPGAVYRTYTSFSHAALENGLSRIYVGFHFRRAVTEGIQHGRRIGHRTMQKVLRPVQ